MASQRKQKEDYKRPHVTILVREIEKELRTDAMKQATQDRIAGKPGKKLEEDSIEVLQPRDARQKYGLKADVSWTRKSAAVAHTFVNGGGGKKMTGYLGELQGQPVADYVDQLKLLAGDHGLKRNLEYLSKSERLQYQLTLSRKDSLFRLANQSSPYQTNTAQDASGNRELDLFAMDQMHLIYVCPQKGAFGTFHHSSFLSGKPVVCAGEIAVDQGRVTKVSNSSGHYLPSTSDLLNCVTALGRQYGVDLQNLAVSDIAKKANWKSAMEFLRKQGMP